MNSKNWAAILTLTAALTPSPVPAADPAQPSRTPWPRALGGPNREYATGIAVDEQGNAYVAGHFQAETTIGTIKLTSSGPTDVFVAKLDREGQILWAVAVGGDGVDEPRGITVAPGGDVYLTGFFSGTADFDPGPGRSELASAGSSDVFLLRLNPKGELVWARRLGGKLGDVGFRIAAGGDAVYLTGYFQGTVDLPAAPSPGQKAAPPARLESAGRNDAFVARFDPSGNLVWARRLGGAKDDEARGIALGRGGEVWVAGHFEEAASLGAETSPALKSAGRADVFVARLDKEGRTLWAGRMGGDGTDECEAAVGVRGGGVAITGRFTRSADFDPGSGSTSLASSGPVDAFIVRLDAAGRLVWARQMGGGGSDVGFGLAADKHGSVYAAGLYQQGRGDISGEGTPIHVRATAGGSNPDNFSYVAELTDSGDRLWSFGVSASDGLQILAIATDPSGVPYIAGVFKGETAPQEQTGASAVKAAGKNDAFVWRLTPAVRPKPGKR